MFCKFCGAEMGMEEECPNCGNLDGERAFDATGGIIPYKNIPALLAYYAGVFSLIPCVGFPLGISSVILGIIGLRTARTRPNARGKVHAWVGIILGFITTLLWGVLIVLMFTNA